MQKDLRKYLYDELVVRYRLINEVYLPFTPAVDTKKPYLIIQQKQDNLVNNATFDTNDFVIYIQIDEEESFSKLHEIQNKIFEILQLRTFGEERKYTSIYKGNNIGDSRDGELKVKYTGVNYQVVALKTKEESNGYEKAVASFIADKIKITAYKNKWTSGFTVPSVLVRSQGIDRKLIAFDTQEVTHTIVVHVVSNKENEIQSIVDNISYLISVNQMIPYEIRNKDYMFLESDIKVDLSKDMLTVGQINFKLSRYEKIFRNKDGLPITEEEYKKEKYDINKLYGEGSIRIGKEK